MLLFALVLCGAGNLNAQVATGPEPYSTPVVPPPLAITYDMSGLPLTITHDGGGVYSFSGLPYPGSVLYTPTNGVVYYQHPEEPVWHTVTPAMLRGVVVPATISQGPVGRPWQDQTTFRWNLTTTAVNPEDEINTNGTACKPMFGSASASEMSGLDVTDILHVLTVMQWLNGGGIPNPCEKLQFSAQQAKAIGLPTIFTGPNGLWQLQEIVQSPADYIQLPNAQPMDDETRLHLLLIQFGPEERANLIRSYGNLPLQQQIELISPLLTQDVTAI
ncbi:MAG: hypothetical protein DI585_02515 [Pseudomonas fluorescens]|nr:MAG: hypothetical protein DI585_02515 [Pseudomonas fluorescens]